MEAPIWTPTNDMLSNSAVAKLTRKVGVADYDELWKWSAADVGRFWSTVWSEWDILADGDPSVALADDSMPGAVWFPNTRLSYPEHVFRGKRPEDVAVHYASEERALSEWTWGRLEPETARVRAGLRAMGVRRGDRVAAYMPNVPETLAAFLATTSLGAIWSCCSPDFGTRTVVDRFSQIEPRILITVEGYRYGGQDFDRSEEVRQLGQRLSSVEHVVTLDRGAGGPAWEDAFPQTDEPVTFERVPFDHPLWIVYSSGTTGLPKPIVHGHGGPLLEGMKTWRFNHDARPGERVFWFTTTGWIMWNYLIGALLSDVSITLFDGNPAAPDPAVLWELADRVDVSVFGAGAAYVHGCAKNGVKPRGDGRKLSSLRSVGSTGSPLAPAGFEWIRDELGQETWTCSTSGGTDIAGAFLGGAPTKPVHIGELSARLLGVAVEAWDDDGQAVVDEVGELVVTAPMPSMPVGFWNDESGERYRDSYFNHFPGVWRHGDWLKITARGSAIIYGRSDSTINRGGIRIGTSEIYSALADIDGLEEALVVDVPPDDGASDSRMTMFVVTDGRELQQDLIDEIRRSIKADCSPRHVPNEVVLAPGIPKTLTGKLLEVPVKRLMMGQDPDAVANRDALQDPALLDWYVDYAHGVRDAKGRRP